jgi:hypothetical protein
MMSEFLEFDNDQAFREGWGIFECHGSDNGNWQLQKDDEYNLFDSDPSAWIFVVASANSGSEYHKQALNFLELNNVYEYNTIIKHYRSTIYPEQ